MRPSIVLFCLAVLCASAQAASFDCTKARSLVEQRICSDPRLGKLDETLAVNFRSLMASNAIDWKKDLRAGQARWLASRNRCQTTPCIAQAYRKRIAETCEYGVVPDVQLECPASGN